MGVAALVLGIISLVLSLIPVVGIAGLGLAILGIIFGIIDWVQKKKKEEKHSQAIAGVICSIIAIVIVLLYILLLSVFVYNVVEKSDPNSVGDFVNTIREYDYNQYNQRKIYIPTDLDTVDL